MDLKFSQSRLDEKEKWEGTGIYIRGQYPDGKWESEDISLLDAESLLEWLRSRGGDNPYAEDVVGILLGHGHLHNRESTTKEDDSSYAFDERNDI